MSKKVALENRIRFINIGRAVAALRTSQGLTQQELAKRADISRSLLSVIESPATPHCFSLEVLFSLAAALGVDPASLVSAADFPDVIKK